MRYHRQWKPYGKLIQLKIEHRRVYVSPVFGAEKDLFPAKFPVVCEIFHCLHDEL